MLGIAATFSPSLKQVFRSKLLGLAAFGIAGMVFLFSVYLPNFRLIRQVVFSKHLAMADKAGFLISLLGSIQTNFTAISATATVLLSILFGVNAAMTLYYVIQRKRASAGRETATPLGYWRTARSLHGRGAGDRYLRLRHSHPDGASRSTFYQTRQD